MEDETYWLETLLYACSIGTVLVCVLVASAVGKDSTIGATILVLGGVISGAFLWWLGSMHEMIRKMRETLSQIQSRSVPSSPEPSSGSKPIQYDNLPPL